MSTSNPSSSSASSYEQHQAKQNSQLFPQYHYNQAKKKTAAPTFYSHTNTPMPTPPSTIFKIPGDSSSPGAIPISATTPNSQNLPIAPFQLSQTPTPSSHPHGFSSVGSHPGNFSSQSSSHFPSLTSSFNPNSAHNMQSASYSHHPQNNATTDSNNNNYNQAYGQSSISPFSGSTPKPQQLWQNQQTSSNDNTINSNNTLNYPQNPTSSSSISNNNIMNNNYNPPSMGIGISDQIQYSSISLATTTTTPPVNPNNAVYPSNTNIPEGIIQMSQLIRESNNSSSNNGSTMNATNSFNNSERLVKLEQQFEPGISQNHSDQFYNSNLTNNSAVSSNENRTQTSEQLANSQPQYYQQQYLQVPPESEPTYTNSSSLSPFAAKTPSHVAGSSVSNKSPLDPTKPVQVLSQHQQHPLVQAFQMAQRDKLSSSSMLLASSPSKRSAYEINSNNNTNITSNSPAHYYQQNRQAANGGILPFQASYSNNNNRQPSPSLKCSVNNGTAVIAPSPFKPNNNSISTTRGYNSQQVQQQQQPTPVSGSSNSNPNVLQLINSKSKITNSRTEMSTSPEGKLHMRINSPSALPSANNNAGTQQQQQNYYKVAQQIRRNEAKDRRLSVASSGYTNTSTTPGAAMNQLTMSQSNGRADGSSSNLISNPRQDSLNARNLMLGKPVKDTSKDAANRKRLSCAADNNNNNNNGNKLNEKYTKKLIIDLCNYMTNSNDDEKHTNNNDQGESQGQPTTNANNHPQLVDDRSRWSAKNNMNMLDILSQQRVLQRSISSSKRMAIKPITSSSKNQKDSSGFNPINNSKIPGGPSSSSAAASTGIQQQQFQQFSGLRSMNTSSSRITWNLNGSQNLNESISSIKLDIKNKKLLSTEAIGLSSIITSTQTMKDEIGLKNIPGGSGTGIISGSGSGVGRAGQPSNNGNLILSCFNDSQEVHSSRNLVMPNTKKQRELSNSITRGQKYKFTNTSTAAGSSTTGNATTHLSKPQTSSNAFAKYRSSPSTQKSGEMIGSSEGKDQGMQKQQQLQQQPFSPEPTTTSCQNSKNSTKSEIKKSQIFSADNTHPKEESSKDNFSRQESFEKDQEEREEDDVSKELMHGDFQEYDGEEEEYNDMEAADGDLPGEDDENDGENEGQTNNASRTSSNKTAESSGAVSAAEQAVGDQIIPSLFQNQKHPTIPAYNYEIELERLDGIHLNMDEYRKERSKLIRKISQTFKIKNKALSTSQEYYKMLHVIGKGAFAKVCLAVQLLTGKLVAIKLIDKNILRSDSAKKRVLQEVQILKKLSNHKHVLRLLEVFENRKLIFIVTEYFQGSDLMKIMKERNGEPFPEEAVKAMLAQILSGLQYIHGNMVLHRDIKLDNMLIDEKGHLKIIDFGISRVIALGQRMTEQCGTPAFLAPEIILNKGYEGFASDYWSLGVLLYILLFGKVPFKGNNLVELHRSIVSGVLSADEMADSRVSKDAQGLLSVLLNTKVKERAGMKEILSSNWMRGVAIPSGEEMNQDQFLINESLTQSVAGKNSKAFDEITIAHIESFGYSREYILRCLNKGSLSHVNAIYQLLKCK